MSQRISIAVPAFLVIALCLWLGGPASAYDPALLSQIIATTKGGTASVAAWITEAGGSMMLVPVALAGAVWLAWKRETQRALFLLGCALGGRMAVELVKLLVERHRPEIVPYPVHVSSFSFPSGHAANSMITFLALALVVAPPAHRRPAVVAAIASSLLIGSTRPVLGVHWPSDVVAGWAFGILWVTQCVALVSRRGETGA